MPNICFIPGLRYTTMLFWIDNTMMSFDVLSEFVETVYSLGQALRPQRTGDVCAPVLPNWKICFMLLIMAFHVTSSDRS
jgi:hypothetical protein